MASESSEILVNKVSKMGFQRLLRQNVVRLKGSKLSLYGGNVVTSSGIPSVDALIGGGFQVGTLNLIEEDLCGTYSKILLKHFIAEGITCQHGMFLSCADVNPSVILKTLPSQIKKDGLPESSRSHNSSVPDDPLKIAWRYEHLPNMESHALPMQVEHTYDLTKAMDNNAINEVKPFIFDVCEEFNKLNAADRSDDQICVSIKLLQVFLEKLTAYITNNKFLSLNLPPNSCANILRICIQSLGSPMWPNSPCFSSEKKYLIKFLYSLRAVLRLSNCVALISIPTHLYEVSFVRKIERTCDAVFKLESFEGFSRNVLYKNYNGIFHIVKLPKLNSLTGIPLPTSNLAFRLHRKKFHVETMHLPPELPSSSNQPEYMSNLDIMPGSSGCGAFSKGGSSKLDF